MTYEDVKQILCKLQDNVLCLDALYGEDPQYTIEELPPHHGRLRVQLHFSNGDKLLMYKSRYGTSGKTEGDWFVNGGTLPHEVIVEDRGFRTLAYPKDWIIKNDKSVAGYNTRLVRILNKQLKEWERN
jgi:hypothetical protein